MSDLDAKQADEVLRLKCQIQALELLSEASHKAFRALLAEAGKGEREVIELLGLLKIHSRDRIVFGPIDREGYAHVEMSSDHWNVVDRWEAIRIGVVDRARALHAKIEKARPPR